MPPSCHLTTAVYRHFVEANHLGEVIARAAGRATADDPAAQAWASKAIGALIAQGEMPREVAEAMGDAYQQLGGGDLHVAMRSSATAEDLPDLSFAGQSG